jgi:hypothetical protein
MNDTTFIIVVIACCFAGVGYVLLLGMIYYRHLTLAQRYWDYIQEEYHNVPKKGA